jgi:hypothetical protein
LRTQFFCVEIRCLLHRHALLVAKLLVALIEVSAAAPASRVTPACARCGVCAGSGALMVLLIVYSWEAEDATKSEMAVTLDIQRLFCAELVHWNLPAASGC